MTVGESMNQCVRSNAGLGRRQFRSRSRVHSDYFGHNTAAAIAGGTSGTTNVWLVTNAQGPLQQLKFTPGLTMASGHKFYYEAVTETEMEIYGFLTPAN